jgi:hypothetical protein
MTLDDMLLTWEQYKYIAMVTHDPNLSSANMNDCEICGIAGLCGLDCPAYGFSWECPVDR